MNGDPRDRSRADAPHLAIIVPVYKHSVYLADALNSALDQDLARPYRIVVVNDGCPFRETDEIGRAFAAAQPDRVTYLRRSNGGLSAARNTGIEHALESWPETRAFYLLDADNLLMRSSMRRATTVLEASDDKVGWLYPSIEMFGIEQSYTNAGDYQPLLQLQYNVSEAGSLIRREVFDAGVRFDESMRLGFEDWEFWLQASRAGFRGQYLPDLGLRYRRRAESMLTGTERSRQEVTAYIRRKHAWLGRPRTALTIEHDQSPRYLIYLTDEDRYHRATDPCRLGEPLDRREVERAFWAAARSPQFAPFPYFFAVTSRAALELFGAAGLTRWLFWYLEDGQYNSAMSFVSHLPARDGEIRVQHLDGHDARATLAMTSFDTLRAVAKDPNFGWFASLLSADPWPKVFGSQVTLPVAPGVVPVERRATEAMVAQAGWLRASTYNVTDSSWEWRRSVFPERNRIFERTREAVGVQAPLWPFRASASTRDVGFVVPLGSFGGVEKVAYAVAAEFKRAGWAPHLFVTAAPGLRLPSEFTGVFDSVNLLLQPEIGVWNPAAAYLGTELSTWALEGRHDRALGLLSGMQLVMNAHGADMNGVMASLRNMGVRTVDMLHVVDQSPAGRPVGHPYLALAYEHAYDLMTTPSQQLIDWCRGMGVPSDKLVLLENAPSYPLPADRIDAMLEDRRDRAARMGPLRALYLGRLDRQKGMERVLRAHELTTRAGAKVEWRFIGASVIGDDSGPAPATEPAVFDSDQLTRAYAWADVIVLLSLWEGVPLTLFEAMRCGVVVVTTDVGAIGEVVRDGVDGLLLNPDSAPEMACAARLLQLADDRDLLLRLGEAAAAAQRSRNWSDTAAPLLLMADRLAPGSGSESRS